MASTISLGVGTEGLLTFSFSASYSSSLIPKTEHLVEMKLLMVLLFTSDTTPTKEAEGKGEEEDIFIFMTPVLLLDFL